MDGGMVRKGVNDLQSGVQMLLMLNRQILTRDQFNFRAATVDLSCSNSTLRHLELMFSISPSPPSHHCSSLPTSTMTL
jgi:hypothetical protein